MDIDQNGHLRILVVEDNDEALHTLCELLGLLGHNATGVESAELGLKQLHTRKFDMLLTDINLPGESGLELARKARILAPDMKIVFVSGNDRAVLATIDFPVGWLSKPYEYSTLVQTLQGA